MCGGTFKMLGVHQGVVYCGFGLGLVEWVQDIPRGYLGRGYGILGMWSEQLVYKKVGSVFGGLRYIGWGWEGLFSTREIY